MKVVSRSQCDLTTLSPEEFMKYMLQYVKKDLNIKGEIQDMNWNNEEERYEILHTYEIPEDQLT